MLVLITVCFALAVSLVLRTFGDDYRHTFGAAWPLVQLAILLAAHGAAGIASWTARYQAWPQKLLWLIAVHVHTVTYALNWPVYAGITGGGETARELPPTITAVALVILPSLLMYGGPITALINPPRKPAAEEATP